MHPAMFLFRPNLFKMHDPHMGIMYNALKQIKIDKDMPKHNETQ